MDAIIDLEKFRTKNAKIFTCRDRVQSVRKQSRIDEKEVENSNITVIIPDNLCSINPSF
jgi:hypothetical protein